MAVRRGYLTPYSDAMPTPAPADLMALDPLWCRMGPRARRILIRVAERLAAGAENYGDDFSPGRDWREEGRDEVLDALVYLARHLED